MLLLFLIVISGIADNALTSSISNDHCQKVSQTRLQICLVQFGVKGISNNIFNIKNSLNVTELIHNVSVSNPHLDDKECGPNGVTREFLNFLHCMNKTVHTCDVVALGYKEAGFDIHSMYVATKGLCINRMLFDKDVHCLQSALPQTKKCQDQFNTSLSQIPFDTTANLLVEECLPRITLIECSLNVMKSVCPQSFVQLTRDYRYALLPETCKDPSSITSSFDILYGQDRIPVPVIG